MANAQETTFKDLQMDERYKRLERTLKMVLLKNADRRSADNGWPSISSINGDNLDMSCAAMSVQSSGIGSEVVASSANFRNIQMHKKQCNNQRVNIATSSENQFPTNKGNDDDSVMMPPPSTPGICFGRAKRFSDENRRIPLHNMPINAGRSNNGFVMSTPSTSISSIPKNSGSISANCSNVFQENDAYDRNAYAEDANNDAQRQERHFSRWRVLLNDKGQLIIKGTLECGKLARSKPVIRRLTATSVQSIFKHTYYLHGNLVDERNELPDYVHGKFFNGFPDDWENVYQVWRNYLNDGSRLSFRWPTAITDSDDDIKSEVTDISYHPQFDKYKKSVSPRKRVRTSQALSARAPIEENNENLLDTNRYSHRSSHNSSVDIPLASSGKPTETPSRVQSKCNRNEDAPLDENKKSTESMNGSINTSGVGGSTLKDIIQEDKLNIIIDNLSNKNCSMEYINKIVEMFDCMKFVVSYQSTGENDPEKNTMDSQGKEPSRSPKKTNRSTEESHENSSTSNTDKNRPDPLHNSATKIDQYENQSTTRDTVGSRNTGKSYKDPYLRQTRRKLTTHDYDTSESENDYYDDNQRSASHRLLRSQEPIRRSHKNNRSYQNSIASRSSRQYVEPEKSLDESHRARKYIESSVPRSHRHDTSLSEEEPVVERRIEPKTPQNRAFASPRKCRTVEKDSRRRMDHYDSSISITDDDERYVNKSKTKATRINQYDSSVSITEDESQGDIRVGRGRLQTLKYHPESSSRPVASESSRNGDIRGDRKKLEKLKYSESNFRPVDPVDANRNLSRQRTPKKIPTLPRSMVVDDNRIAQVADHPVQHYDNTEVETNNFMTEQQEDSAGLPSEIKRAKNPEAIREKEFYRTSESPEMQAPKNKTPQVRKKPVVIRNELTDINLKSHNWLRANSSNENDKNAVNTPRISVDRLRVNAASNDDDDERYVNKSKAKATRINQYDSSVSITEDESQGDIRVDRGRLQTLKYHPESSSHPVASESSRNGDIRGDRKKLESLKYSESNFRPVDPVDANRNLSTQGTPKKIPALPRSMVVDDNRIAQVADHPVQHYDNTEVETNHFMTEQQEDSAGLPSEIKRAKNPEAIREKEFYRSFESPEIQAPKNKTPQVRKKPVVISNELTDINLKSHNWLHANSSNENDKNAVNTARISVDRLRVNAASNDAKNTPNSQKTSVDTPLENGKITEPTPPKSATKETTAIKLQNGKSSTNEFEKAEKPTGTDMETPTAKFGSQENPKPLTAWVPAVVCDDEGDAKYHLVFEGKLLNEAGHVVNRKFITDFIRRRVSAKLVETINQEFYQLVGDLNDTKHVVPKELLKLCHSGCPSKIGHFCDKWKAVTTDNNTTPPRDRSHNQSVDCLSVPKSSRGRRILPPLNYWTGERIATKDHIAVYSPGNAQESSIPSSLEKSNEEVVNDKKSPSKAKRAPNPIDQNGKRMDEPKASATKRKNSEKVSPTKVSMQSPQKMKAGKRRMVKNVHTSSSDSEIDEQKKSIPRKRKTRTNGQVLNTASGSTRKTRNSSKNNNTASPQSFEGSEKGSFEKMPESEAKSKLRKRQKIDCDEEPSVLAGTSKQCLTRRNAVVTCTHYKNVPFGCDDLSEDQLSTM